MGYLIEIYKKIITSPRELFQDITNDIDRYRLPVYFLFFINTLIPLVKSFRMARENIDFFSNETLNLLLSLYSIPQVQWVVTLLVFFLFIILINFFSRFFSKNRGKSALIFCLLSIASVGILMQLLLTLLSEFLSHELLAMIRWIAFFWIAFLSIVAINICKKTSYVRALTIYFAAGLPVVLIVGLAGVAPFILWATN
jgi:hypothetical protein